MPGRVAGRDRAGRRITAVVAVGQREDRPEAGEGFGGGVAAGVLVFGDDRLAALGVADRDRREFRGEPAGVHRGDRLLVARERERVLVLAADVLADRDALGVRAHVAVLDRAPQAVADGRVLDLGVAEAVAEARARQQVRRAVHRLHAAGDRQLGVAGPDLGRGEHDRLQAGAADAVDRRGGRRVREAGPQDRLSRRRLAGAALEDHAHEDVIEGGRRRIEAGLLDGGADRDPTELDGRHGRQSPTELADRRSRGTDEIDVAVRAGRRLGHVRESTSPGARSTVRSRGTGRRRRSSGGSGWCPRRSGRPSRRA